MFSCKKKCVSHICRGTTKENNQFSKLQTLFSNSYLIRHSLKGTIVNRAFQNEKTNRKEEDEEGRRIKETKIKMGGGLSIVYKQFKLQNLQDPGSLNIKQHICKIWRIREQRSNSNFTETMHRDNNRGIKITKDRIHR